MKLGLYDRRLPDIDPISPKFDPKIVIDDEGEPLAFKHFEFGHLNGYLCNDGTVFFCYDDIDNFEPFSDMVHGEEFMTKLGVSGQGILDREPELMQRWVEMARIIVCERDDCQ